MKNILLILLALASGVAEANQTCKYEANGGEIIYANVPIICAKRLVCFGPGINGEKSHAEQEEEMLKKWRQSLKVADRTEQGVIVELKNPLANIQTDTGMQWFPISELKHFCGTQNNASTPKNNSIVPQDSSSKKTVKECVDIVHSIEQDNWLYKGFDAYYDESTKKISYLGNQQSRFQFEKCMAEKGHSLISR